MNDYGIINAPEQPMYPAGQDQGGSNLAVQLARAELDMNIVTARQYPRSYVKAMNNILSLVTMDETSAKECVYALPRGDKPITGPSVRFAEIVASQWGNCHIGSRVVAVDVTDKVVIAEGVFWDLETGMKRVAQVRRRITDRKGRLFNDDMIVVTGNAAASVAMREAILKGVPKAIWRKAYDAAVHVIAGDVKTLNVRRGEAVKAFAAFGVRPEMICEVLDIEGVDEIGIEEIATLITMFNDIKSGETQVETFFPMLAGKARPPKGGDKPAADSAKKQAEPEQTKAEEPKEKAAAKEAQPKEEPTGDLLDRAAPTEQRTGPDEKEMAALRRDYDRVLSDAMDGGRAAAIEANRLLIDNMEARAPEMHAALMGELQAFA